MLWARHRGPVEYGAERKKMKLIDRSDLRKYGEEEVRQALLILRSNGDQFYCDVLRSILLNDAVEINPPVLFFTCLLNSGLTRKEHTTDISFLKSAIYTHIQLNRDKYLTEMEQISRNLKEREE